MLNKLFALSVRGGITFGLAIGLVLTLKESFNAAILIQNLAGTAVLILGGIYSLLKFNQPFNINALEEVDSKIRNIIDDQSKRKVEDDMLRVKKLLDSGILTQEEYEQKIKVLKNKYL